MFLCSCLAPEPVPYCSLELSGSPVPSLVQSDLPTYIVELAVNRVQDFVGVDQGVPCEVPLLPLIPHEHLLLVFPSAFADDAPLVHQEHLALKLFHSLLRFSALSIDGSLVQENDFSLKLLFLFGVLITVKFLHILGYEVIGTNVTPLAIPLAFFDASHFLIKLEESTGVFLNVFHLEGDFISQLELHLLQLATSREFLGLVCFILVFTIVIREFGHDFY